MSWDIYGNHLRRGHCEVHPHVHEEYPCSICMAERNRPQINRHAHEEFERLQYELDQQGDYIRHLESERAVLAAQVESLLDDRKEFVKKEFQLLKEIERLEIELKKRDEQNAALAAQVLKLEKRIKAINEGINEYKSMSNDATADLVHKALMDVREEIIQRDLYQSAPDFIEQFANQYADSIRNAKDGE